MATIGAMATPERLSDFLAAARREMAGELRDDAYTRTLYSTDASLYQAMPHAVLIPRTADDVVAAVSLAAAYGMPVLARAAGTSLAGQAVNEALIIDFTRHLDAIVAINPEERWARVQPGVVLDDLNAALQPHGLQFGPDPASSDRSTLGGAVANNATGSHSIRYGMTADHVLETKVVLSDGTSATFGPGMNEQGSAAGFRIANKLRTMLANTHNQHTIRADTPRHWRRCGGYNLDRLLPERAPNLARLIAGSEGTLAVMTEITVGLVPLPPCVGLALLQFDDLYLALSAVPAILQTDPSAVELLDTLSLRLCRDVPEYARLLASVVEGQPHSLLIIEYEGESEAAVRAGVERLRAVRGLGETGLTLALTPAQQSAIWRVRKVGLGLLMSIKGDMKPAPFIEDAAVPVEHLPEYVRQIEAYCAALDTPISYYAHASAGCLHIRPLLNTRSAADLAKMPDIAAFAAGLIKGYGGALSSEHGDGRTRTWLNEAFYGPELYGLFRQVKHLFDPHNLLNPGVIVDGRPMTDSLRALPTVADRPRLDFSDYEGDDTSIIRITIPATPTTTTTPNGFIRAIEMCNGAGICRQRIRGTMCPSFMVTREEEHSTRGRA
ncbi:FAD-linked oxidase C-terminal domain-containing protein, partial [Promineifilum sp.]|uniref:FAD-linked oxidase C-terminal domain-containing protein n=1 Tax=Promineifilum sp. TaxID=2664178 RepID=UPI0035B0D79E